MLSLFLIPYCAVTAHMCGGSLGGRHLYWFEKCALFALPIAMLQDNAVYAAAAWVWSACWMNTGHGTVLDPREAVRGRKQTLSVVIDPLCKLLRQPLGGGFYCLAFTVLKGALIGMPLCFAGPSGAPACFWLSGMWSLSYAARHDMAAVTGMSPGRCAEMTSGAATGTACFIVNA